MSREIIGSPTSPEQNKKEALFQSWIVEMGGKLWVDSDVMTQEVYDAYQAYKHGDVSNYKERFPERMKENAFKFKELTGYGIEDFMEYFRKQKDKLEQKRDPE